MALFPVLRVDELAVPLPPTALTWIARLFADSPEANRSLLLEAIEDSASLATFIAAANPAWRESMPPSHASLADWASEHLLGRLTDDLDVADVELDQLDQWSAAHKRVLWLRTQYRDRSEAELLLCLFAEGCDWFCGVDGETLEASTVPIRWLRGLSEEIHDEHAEPSNSPLGQVRRQYLRFQSLDAAAAAPSRTAPFRRWAKEDVLDFVETVERMGRRYQRTRELERQFFEAVEREKLEALKELAYGASHEINNPLANIATRAQTLIRDETDAERRRSLATINAQAFRAHEMISDMMLFARPPKLNRGSFDLRQIAAQIVQEALSEAELQETELRLTPGDAVFAEVDETHLSAALRALIRNALEALKTGGVILVDIRNAGDQSVCIEVRDNGPGIPDSVRPRIFDPYFSGREAGRGLGLGLSKAWSVVRAHGGQLTVDAEEGQGATMRMLLPQRSPAAKTASYENTRNAGA